ncbi:MAG: porin family protein [Hyphomicrobiales bacterium]|nr:porin family protein [Hyphomicrobiales bacterium]
MKKFVRAAILAIAAFAGAAQAADLPRRSYAPSYAPASVAPVFTWTGFYVGLNAGYGWNSLSGGANQLFGTPSGFSGGVTGGFNWQAAPNVVVGLEGDWDLTSINNKNNLPFFGFSGQTKVNNLATVRARAGYAVDRALLYVTGGLAMGSVTTSVTDLRFPFFGNESSFRAGFALGAGIEYAFSDHVSAKAEYMFTSLNAKDVFAYSPDWTRSGHNISQVRVGLNYHF